MKNAALMVAMAMLVMCKSAAMAQVTFQYTAPDPNGGLLHDDGQSTSNESRLVRWGPSEPNLGVAQNFKVSSNITMDKYAVQLRPDLGPGDNLVLPSGDAPITVSLWRLPDLDSTGAAGYPAASASVGSVPLATWNLTVEAANQSAGNAAWLIFDTPNIALTAGTQYGIQLGWPAETSQVGQKIWVWISKPDSLPEFPLGEMAIYTQGDPSLNASYNKTYRSQNFAIIAAVPEPATLGLLSFGGLCCLLSRRRWFQ
jgi:hypothetical protein